MSEHELPPLELTGFRHTVSRQVMLMTPEEAPIYVNFTESYVTHFKVDGPVEEQLAFSLADTQWRLNSTRAMQNNMLSLELAKSASIEVAESKVQSAILAAQRQPKKAMTLRELSMYEQRLNRQFHQDLKTLRSLQNERKQEQQGQLEEAAQILKLEIAKTPPGEPCAYNPTDDGYTLPIAHIEKHLHLRGRRREAQQLEKALKTAA
jgi:hypothetical protein